MTNKISRKIKRGLRHSRVRRKISGTNDIPRVAIFRSSKHIYAQIIDDINRKTLLQASSLTKDVAEIIKKDTKDKPSKVDVANYVGKYLGEQAVSNGIKKVCFDRGGYLFHGRVKSLADGLREKGVEF